MVVSSSADPIKILLDKVELMKTEFRPWPFPPISTCEPISLKNGLGLEKNPNEGVGDPLNTTGDTVELATTRSCSNTSCSSC